ALVFSFDHAISSKTPLLIDDVRVEVDAERSTTLAAADSVSTRLRAVERIRIKLMQDDAPVDPDAVMRERGEAKFPLTMPALLDPPETLKVYKAFATLPYT